MRVATDQDFRGVDDIKLIVQNGGRTVDQHR